MPLVQFLKPDAKFSDFIQKVQTNVIKQIDVGMYPYDMITKLLNVSSNSSLFDVMFTYQSENSQLPKLENEEINISYANTKTAKFNLSMEIIPNVNILNLEYNTDLFKETTINNLIEHYTILLDNIIQNPDSHIACLEI